MLKERVERQPDSEQSSRVVVRQSRLRATVVARVYFFPLGKRERPNRLWEKGFVSLAQCRRKKTWGPKLATGAR